MSNNRAKIKSVKMPSPLSTSDKIAAGIRKALFGKHGEPDDISMPSRLSSAVYDWLKSRHPEDYSGPISNFNFTDAARSFKSIWKVPLQIEDLYDGHKLITYPALNPLQAFFPPANTFSIRCSGILAVIDISSGEPICVSDFLNRFTYINKDVKEKIFKVRATGSRGNLTVVYMLLHFFRRDGEPVLPIGEASGLVAAIYRR